MESQALAPLSPQLSPQLLLELADAAFDERVYRAVLARERTAADDAAFRDAAVVNRTLEAVERIVAALNHRLEVAQRRRDAVEVKTVSRLLERATIERRALRPLANEARERQLAAARTRSPRYRAMVRLSKLHPQEFLALVREEQEKDSQKSG